MALSPKDPLAQTLKQEVLGKLNDLRSALRVYRARTGMRPHFLRDGNPPALRADACTADARVFVDRFAMMRALAVGPLGCEVGVDHGKFSRFMLDELPLTHLDLVDLLPERCAQDVRDDPRVTFHAGDSATLVSGFPRNHYDWIYIDGDHRHAGVQRDIDAALPRVKPGGILFFNDYTSWSVNYAEPYGVIPAVNTLVNAGHDIIGLGLAPSGFMDIAVRCNT